MNIDWRQTRLYQEQALSAEEMIGELRGSDPRPLLIIRPVDEKKDKQVFDLFQAAIKSERFQLASQWFHCIKLEEKNIEESIYRKLFDGRNPAHMILATWDGKYRVELLGTTSHKVTWKKITSVLSKAYKQSPDQAIKQLEKVLNTFDALDQRETELQAQRARCDEKGKASQVKKVDRQLAELADDREEALELERDARELELRRDDDAPSDD
ncbi:MAG: hypothetical protein KDB80_01715 [Planctomycetes bacterium]|nr:hypothetical protein [Planctomycetota bacterium]